MAQPILQSVQVMKFLLLSGNPNICFIRRIALQLFGFNMLSMSEYHRKGQVSTTEQLDKDSLLKTTASFSSLLSALQNNYHIN